MLVTIGACATSGGIQALRNFTNVNAFVSAVYAHPEYIDTLRTSTPIADHVHVDFELNGCPINKYQLLEVVNATLNGRKPNISANAVCLECKLRGTSCIMVAHGIPCMGPVTHAGCNAICPFYNRGCFGCYGPKEAPNTSSVAARFRELGMDNADIMRQFRLFTAASREFEDESVAAEKLHTETRE